MGALLRAKLWIGLGLILVVSLLLFLLGAMPRMRSNNQLLQALTARAEELERFTKAGSKNELWIDQQKDIANKLQEQVHAIESRLLERDALLERRFDDPEYEKEGPLEYGRWMFVYKHNMTALREKLAKSVTLVTVPDPLVEARLGLVWLSVNDMHQLEKQYWMQKAIVDAIADLNAEARRVPVFGGFRFLGRPERYMSPSHMVNFTCAAFGLDVVMDPKFLPALLQKLLEAPDERAPLGIELTSITISRHVGGLQGQASSPSMQRTGYAPFGPEGLEAPMKEGPGLEEQAGLEPETAEALPDKMVAVHIVGYVPDYEQPEEKKPAAERSGIGTTYPGGP